MRRLTNRLLILLALALLALGAAAQFALVHTPVPPLVFVVGGAILGLLLVLAKLPLVARRPIVFLITLAFLAALTGGLAYFQFVIKPPMIKGFISAAFAPKPTAVAAEAVKVEKWPPELTAIGTLRAYQGVLIAPQAAGVVTAKHFDSGEDVEAGALLINIDDSVEQADLANGLAQLKNADATLTRQKTLVAQGNTPQSTVDTALATRDSAAATVERTRAVIAQKAIKAPVRRQARPAQCRSRAICRGGDKPGDAPAARPDLRRLSRARGGFALARRRSARQHDRRRHPWPQFRGQDRGDRRARQRRIRATSPRAPCSPILTASFCPACSPI